MSRWSACYASCARACLVGLTATPFRLRGGYLHQGPDAWFSDIAYEIGVAELIEQGYLAPLTGKKSRAATIDTAGLRVERGDYRESDLAELVDDDDLNARIVDEIVRCGADRRAWLVFAVGEALEEEAIQAAAEGGLQIDRRGDANAAAVLGLAE